MPSQTIKNVGIIAKPRIAIAGELLPKLVAWIESRSCTPILDENSSAYAGRADGVDRAIVGERADLIVVLGGDGTLLSAARASIRRDIPLFAVNLGGLGFLTAIKIEDLYPQLDRALRGELQSQCRLMLHSEIVRDGKTIATYEGLNDLVLAKTEMARMIDLEAYIDGNFVCVYKADGLLIATPTGSTAYSLSAGGPIVLPTVAGLAMTPICPHMLTNRPVIVPDTSVVEVVVRGDASTYLTVDGQLGEALFAGDRVTCRKSQHFTRLIRPENLLFFDVLREKLKWGGR
jgi:NAD+ kinase